MYNEPSVCSGSLEVVSATATLAAGLEERNYYCNINFVLNLLNLTSKYWIPVQ